MNSRVTVFGDEPAGNALDDGVDASRIAMRSWFESLRSFASVSEALRILGAAVILASMSLFLLQGWNDGNDIRRYLLLLTQTGLLGAAGFAMSHVVKETRGARLFFGLALVSVPANFTILGALLYSVFQWDGTLATYPGFAHWRIDDIASIGFTLSAAMLVLVPVTVFCFAVMARGSAKYLSINFLLLNALLLLPIRGSVAAGSIALLGVVYALFVIRRLPADRLALKTAEGKFALATLFLPLGIILFRSMYFYQVDSLMIAMVGTAVFLAARTTSSSMGTPSRVAALLDFLSWPLALVVSVAMTDTLWPMLNSQLLAPAFSLLFTLFCVDVIRRTRVKLLARAIAASVALFVAGSLTLGVALLPYATAAFCSLFGGLMLLAWGVFGRKLITVLAGLVAAGAGLWFGFDAMMQWVLSSSWVDLAVIGAGAIAVGSLLDRYGAALQLQLKRWFDARGDKRSALNPGD